MQIRSAAMNVFPNSKFGPIADFRFFSSRAVVPQYYEDTRIIPAHFFKKTGEACNQKIIYEIAASAFSRGERNKMRRKDVAAQKDRRRTFCSYGIKQFPISADAAMKIGNKKACHMGMHFNLKASSLCMPSVT